MEHSLQIINSKYIDHSEWLGYILHKYNYFCVNKVDDIKNKFEGQGYPELEKERNEYEQKGKNYIFINYMKPDSVFGDLWTNIKPLDKLVNFVKNNGSPPVYSKEKINKAEELIDSVFDNKYKSQIIIEGRGGAAFYFEDFIGIVLKEI